MGCIPDKAMVLAAGLGTRMRPLTDTRPKPLVEVAGKPLIDHALDRLSEAGIGEAVVNVHYLADLLEAHLGAHRGAPTIHVSDERAALLETGGGIVKALPLLGDAPFLLTNADSFWIEGTTPNILRLARAYDPERMDFLLLLAPAPTSVGISGRGDFSMRQDGQLSRRIERHVAPFIYSGTAIVHPRVFAGAPKGRFSLNRLFDTALENGRLYGLRLEGLWLHVGTPAAITDAERAIADSAA